MELIKLTALETSTLGSYKRYHTIFKSVHYLVHESFCRYFIAKKKKEWEGYKVHVDLF